MPSGLQIGLILAAAAVGAPAGWASAQVGRAYGGPAGRRTAATHAAGAMTAFAWAAAMTPFGPILAASLGLAWVLLCLAAIDLAVFRLPDVFTLGLTVAGLALAALLTEESFADHAVGAMVGFGALAGLAWLYRRVRGVDGVGLGDAKLLGAAGAWLGWRALPSVVLIACFVALAWVGVVALAGQRSALKARIAFGAPLALATWIVWLHGPLAP